MDLVDSSADTAPASGRTLRTALVAIIAIAVVAIAAAAGYAAGHSGSSSKRPGASSVDAGFAWDMSAHHLQAVTLANYARDHTKNTQIYTLAFDIETSQFSQVGEMKGWLESWGLPANDPNPAMSWMAAHMQMGTDGLMPGMATAAEVSQFQTMTGTAMDIRFLQLMLRHHQGGLPMAKEAAARAKEAYVRNSAQHMVDAQQSEVLLMEELLRERGAQPLPPPE